MSKNRKGRIAIRNGFTIIEALVVVFIFSLITVTFYSMLSLGTRFIHESKYKLGAVAVANERMEIIRSLNYDQIGTDTGYISGDIPSVDQVTVDNRTFFVFSSVAYIDSEYDGIEDGTPDDPDPTDMKRVMVKVAWENDINTDRGVSFSADFAPPGVEENVGGGTLVIKVLNKDSVGIQGFNVHIVNSGLGINENFTTDANGGISLAGVPSDGNDYEVTISKSGYSGIATLPTYPASTFYPTYAHASVTDGVRNIYSITTDALADLTFATKDFFDSDVINIGYNLEGGIKKGDTTDSPSIPIYYYDEDLNSGSDGENSIDDISYGAYTFTFTDAVSDYEFVKMDPYDPTLNDKTKFMLDPGSDTEAKSLFVDKNLDSALITVLDSSTSLPVANASVRFYNLSLTTPYDVTRTTDEYGLVFFPETMPALEEATYDIEIQATDYQNKSDTIIVSGLSKKEINIDPD